MMGRMVVESDIETMIEQGRKHIFETLAANIQQWKNLVHEQKWESWLKDMMLNHIDEKHHEIIDMLEQKLQVLDSNNST